MRSSKSFTNLFQIEDAPVRPSTSAGNPTRTKRKYIQLVTNTGVRRLLIPEKRVATSVAGTVDQQKLNAIKTQVQEYINPESKFEKALRILEEKERRALESELRKQSLERCARRCRTAGSSRNQIQADEDFRRDNLLVARAGELQREREDEMKLCNSLILMSKCQTVRDAQVAEKTLIAKELKAVELELDRLMEADRLKGVEADDRLREEEEAKKRHQFESLTRQIELNRELREMAVCAVEKERCRLRKIEAERAQELEEEKKRRLMEQERRREEIDEANAALRQMKEERKKQEVLLNLKIQNILKEKIAGEEKREVEKAQLRLLRDKEFARLEKERKRNTALEEAQYETKCRQVQEECDREWRRRELEEQRKRKKTTEELLECRRKQQEYRQHYQAMEQDRNRTMNQLIEDQRRSEIEKEKEKERAAKEKTLAYRRNLQKLMEEKQTQRRRLKEEKLEEGRRMREEGRQRVEALKAGIERKIGEVRKQRVPEKYIKEVEKQLHKQLMKIRI